MVSTLHVRLIEIYLPAKFQSSSSKKFFARASGFSGFWPHFDDVITGHVIFQKFSYCFNGPFKSLTTTWKKNHFSISSQKKVFWCENFLVSTRTHRTFAIVLIDYFAPYLAAILGQILTRICAVSAFYDKNYGTLYWQ